jgi:alanine dehydrogenase
MEIGIPREIKDSEGRVSLSPSAVSQLVRAGHPVKVEQGAGIGSGFQDKEYLAVGAFLVAVEEAWQSDLVIKVKEPLPSEYPFLSKQILFTFLHLSGVDTRLTDALLTAGTSGVAYETLEAPDGSLPILAPMSAIAGNMSALVGSYYLGRAHGGKGVQLGQVLGHSHGKVLVIGDGVVAQHAARSAAGLGASVVMLGLDARKGEILRAELGTRFSFRASSHEEISRQLPDTDLLIGAVLRRGAKADFVVKQSQIKLLNKGSVVVDVSIDQGGCIETSRPTSHSHPVYVEEGVTHYCVTNMPGAYPRTSTLALSEAVLPYAIRLADKGVDAFREDPGFARALNTYEGTLVIKTVADDLHLSRTYRDNPFI